MSDDINNIVAQAVADATQDLAEDLAEELIQAANSGPKVLVFDIETAPLQAHVWSLWENNVSLNQIVSDWHVMGWSAKWLGAPDTSIMYMDQRNEPNMEDDRNILNGIWKLLDEADVVITQNGKKFDQKKLQARFAIHGIQPPSSYRHIDTKQIASRHFAFSSNKLEYLTDKLCVKYKKLKHSNFPGHTMWVECLKRNMLAWDEMELYNKHDVLALEELYYALIPWDNTINFNVYNNSLINECSACKGTELMKNGFYYSQLGKYQKFRCKDCGCETRSKENLLSKEKRASLTPRTIR